ncbi:MAG: trypsin-like peptidase domain-containing protein [Flavobacteriaceae bacterium]|jgi:hypothetical protein|nr:trypsin-like peptidase domain-containing protein [Flavobacteriaceae bacterium]
MQLELSEQLMYSTIRIECENEKEETSTGTGFFFCFQKDNYSIPVIITNKHVVKGYNLGKLLFTLQDENENPKDQEHYRFEIRDFEKYWIDHSDPDIDLCVMPISFIIQEMSNKGKKPFLKFFRNNDIPTLEQLKELVALEDIIMIGYPNGIWDKTNNQPILRKGITATHPNKDYNGKKEFMIDAACFPGSSGSPVLIFDKNGYVTKSGGFAWGAPRIFLLGVLYAGPQHTVVGEIDMKPISTQQIPVSISAIPNNLGLVIKSEKIFEIEKKIFDNILTSYCYYNYYWKKDCSTMSKYNGF